MEGRRLRLVTRMEWEGCGSALCLGPMWLDLALRLKDDSALTLSSWEGPGQGSLPWRVAIS